jgi:hypothetical protein
MSRVTENWTVGPISGVGPYIVLTSDGTPHTRGILFEDESDAYDWIEAIQEAYDEQEDRYLEENSRAIAQSELYEQHRNEF